MICFRIRRPQTVAGNALKRRKATKVGYNILTRKRKDGVGTLRKTRDIGPMPEESRRGRSRERRASKKKDLNLIRYCF